MEEHNVFNTDFIKLFDKTFDRSESDSNSKIYSKIPVQKTYVCSFPECNKIFKEKGNLKTHLRIHVKLKNYKNKRQEKNRFFVHLKIAIKVSRLKVTLKFI